MSQSEERAIISMSSRQGPSQGGGERGNPPPPKPKKCCRKMVLFQKALFLVTNFRKKIKIKKFNFSIEFSSKNFKMFSKLINFLFSPNAEKINAWFVKFFEKYAFCTFS